MPDDLERRLRDELAGGAYGLTLDRGTILAAVETRLAHGRAWRRGGAALAGAAAVVAIIGGVAALTSGDKPPGTDYQVPSLAVSFDPMLTVRGAPAGFAPVDFEESRRSEPALSVVPEDGVRTAYESTDHSTVWRLIVATDWEQGYGLPGSAVELPPEWRIELAGPHLISDDGVTLYFVAWEPDGRSWFFALTGEDFDARTAALRPLIEENLIP